VAQVTSGTVLPGSTADGASEVVVGSLLVESVRRLHLQPAD
jgi:hypothetical protein